MWFVRWAFGRKHSVRLVEAQFGEGGVFVLAYVFHLLVGVELQTLVLIEYGNGRIRECIYVNSGPFRHRGTSDGGLSEVLSTA